MSEIIPCPDAHQTIWVAFGDRDYRHAYSEGNAGDFLASQINSMRRERGWTQAELAKEAGVNQPQICGWESSCIGVNLTSLHKLSEAFDVALIVKFAPFSELAREVLTSTGDRHIPSFDEDSPDAIRTSSVSIQLEAPRHKKGRKGAASESYLRPFQTTGSTAFGA